MSTEPPKKSRKRKKVPGTHERAYKARCAPTPRQARRLARLLGSKRFVWNWALELKQAAYQKDKTQLGVVELCKALTQLRQQPDAGWLAALPLVPLQQTLRDLNTAFSRFFKGQAKYPRFKRRQYAGAVRFQLDQRRAQVDRQAGTVQLDGVGKLRFKVTQGFEGDLLSATISRDAAGDFYVSFTADRVVIPKQQLLIQEAVGIDLGVKDLLVTSDGWRVPVSPRLCQKERQLKRYQRSQSRKLTAAMAKAGLDPTKPIPKGKGPLIKQSKRFTRCQRRIGRLYADIRHQRTDLTHQATTHLVKSYALIGMETLSIKGMAQSFKGIRRGVANACLGEIRRQLEYKVKWQGRALVKVGRFYPSSQRCNDCGWRNTQLKLSERTWTCQDCGATHDRDLNAARSVLTEALRIVALNPIQYPQVAGNLRTGSVRPGEGSPSPTLDTRNRELMPHPATPVCSRQACRTQAMMVMA